VSVRSAVATYLIIFIARRGGEPVRLLVSQWEEALRGEWLDQSDLPEVDESDLVSHLSNWKVGKSLGSGNVSARMQ